MEGRVEEGSVPQKDEKKEAKREVLYFVMLLFKTNAYVNQAPTTMILKY